MLPNYKRTPLVVVNSVGITTGGSADFGACNVAGYSRFTGLWTTVGSLTLRVRTGVGSGNYQVSSSFAVNSGPGTFDVLNFGQQAYFDITLAQSTVYSLLLNGEPMR